MDSRFPCFAQNHEEPKYELLMSSRPTPDIIQSQKSNIQTQPFHGAMAYGWNDDAAGQYLLSVRPVRLQGPNISMRVSSQGSSMMKEYSRHHSSFDDVHAAFSQPNIDQSASYKSTQSCVINTSPAYPTSVREGNISNGMILPTMPPQYPQPQPPPPQQQQQQLAPLQLSAPFLRVLAQAWQLSMAPSHQNTSMLLPAWNPMSLSSGWDALRLFAAVAQPFAGTATTGDSPASPVCHHGDYYRRT